MGVCKYRVSDRCMKSGFNCIFDKKCFEPEEKPVETNADRIRSMNDEELARQLVVKVDDVEGISLFLSLPTERMFITKSIAEKITLEWLKKMEKTNDGVRKMIGGGNMEWTHLDNKLPPKKKDVLLYFDSRKMAVTERGGAFNA